MSNKNQRLIKGRVNPKALAFILLLSLLVLLGAFYIKYSENHDQKITEKSQSIDIHEQKKYAQNELKNLQELLEEDLQEKRNGTDINEDYKEKDDNLSFMSEEEIKAYKEVKAYEDSISTEEDEYRRYKERLQKEPVIQHLQQNSNKTYQNPHTTRTLEKNDHLREILNSKSRVNLRINPEKKDELLEKSDYREGNVRQYNHHTLESYQELLNHDDESQDRMRQPKTPFCILQGSVIRAVLINGINSDLPGQISAQVSEDVFDTPKGRFVLIPRGSRLIGQYASNPHYGQERVFLAFNRLIFPNGKSLRLNAMPGQSADGYSGFDAHTDNHFFKLLSGCFMLSAISTSNYKMQRNDNDFMNTQEAMSLSIAQNLNQVMTNIVERNMNISPTLKVKPGFLFSVAVTQDLYFDGPYRRSKI